jgi:hypothetical protein
MTDGGITHIAMLLFSKYLLAFELASVLLLLAMVGAILLSLRTFPEEQAQAVEAAASDGDGTKAISAGAPQPAAKVPVSSTAGAK